MKLKRILLAVDHGAPSWEAARLTAHLAPRLKAAVGVVTVLVLEPQERGAKDQRIREYVTALELTADIVKEMADAGIRATAQVRSGEPRTVATEILESAARFRADLIVMGSRGRQDLGSALLVSRNRNSLTVDWVPVMLGACHQPLLHSSSASDNARFSKSGPAVASCRSDRCSEHASSCLPPTVAPTN
jgi:nucleotide-binding universal stress UspA family protein